MRFLTTLSPSNFFIFQTDLFWIKIPVTVLTGQYFGCLFPHLLLPSSSFPLSFYISFTHLLSSLLFLKRVFILVSHAKSLSPLFLYALPPSVHPTLPPFLHPSVHLSRIPWCTWSALSVVGSDPSSCCGCCSPLRTARPESSHISSSSEVFPLYQGVFLTSPHPHFFSLSKIRRCKRSTLTRVSPLAALTWTQKTPFWILVYIQRTDTENVFVCVKYLIDEHNPGLPVHFLCPREHHVCRVGCNNNCNNITFVGNRVM